MVSASVLAFSACGPPDAGDTSELRTCAQTHQKVGWTVRLTERFHGTRGLATLVDDCTITFSEFSYDGGGLDVRIRGAFAPDWAGGIKIGPQLLGTRRQSESFSVNVPVDRSLDDFDAVSIWCESANVSFADGIFAAP